MDISVDRAARLSKENEPYLLSGRCSVFCKSDCTHALNKGVEKAGVAAGLCKMTADKITGLISKQKSKKIIIAGGVSKNIGVLRFLRETYPDIYVPKEAAYMEALGASIAGLRHGEKVLKNRLFKTGSAQYTSWNRCQRAGQGLFLKQSKRIRQKKMTFA